MRRTRIKVCGMTQVHQVEQAVEMGVDAIGVILHAESPRTISLSQARSIREVVPEFVSLVGVFVDAPDSLVQRTIEQVGIDLVQYHGQESCSVIDSLGAKHIKAIRAQTLEQVLDTVKGYPNTQTFLLDPYVEGQHGGTGQTLDASLWPNNAMSNKNFILAGGLSDLNVKERVRALKPYAVDANSGLEDSPGSKNIERLARFINEVKLADSE